MQKAHVAGPKEGALMRALETRLKGVRSLPRPVPIALRDAWTGEPDLPYLAGRARTAGDRIDDQCFIGQHGPRPNQHLPCRSRSLDDAALEQRGAIERHHARTTSAPRTSACEQG